MPPIEDDDDEIELDVEDLFKDPEEPETDPIEESDDESQKPDTKAVSKRINEVRTKTERDTQERVAKELGYDSYQDMMDAKEKKMLRDRGLDEDDVTEVVEKLVEQRIANDPRMKKLQEIEDRDKEQFVKSQLAEINKLPGQTERFTSLDQLAPETLELWEKTGNLKQAYLATKGEELMTKSSSKTSNGSLDHLATGGSAGGNTKTRRLTTEEKAIWRSINPDITDEELDKKTTKI